MKRRVVVTGLGAITPVGHDVASSWEAVLNGHSGVTLLPEFDNGLFSTKIGADIKNFNAVDYIHPKDVKRLDLFILYGAVAANQAIKDAGLVASELAADRIGVVLGSGIGGLPSIERTACSLEKNGPRKVSPFFIPGSIINTLPGYVSMLHGFLGPNLSLVSACATASHNIGQAMRMIQYGDADVVVTGGAEMSTCPIGMAGFAACRALSQRNDEPTKACRPWDKDRDGFVMGSGAGALVLESLEHALARGATIYAEIAGFGMSSDAHHFTAPHPEALGATLAMTAALRDAQMNPEDIQYINAHATSTPIGDELEVLAIKKTFGEHAYKMMVSSTKSVTGHLLGAAGAVEAIFGILGIRDQVAPPTINLDQADKNCDLDFVPHTARNTNVNAILSNSFGFGGTNAALIFKKYV